MRRIGPLALLLLLPSAVRADDDFATIKRSFEVSFARGSAADRAASVRSMATFGNVESTAILVSAIPGQQDRIEEILSSRDLARSGGDRKLQGRDPGPYLHDLKVRLDAEYVVMEEIEKALARLGDPEAVAYLAKSVLGRAKHWKSREIAARALGAIGSRDHVGSLAKSLRDKDPRVRAVVIASLGELRAVEAIPDLLECLEDKDWTVRAATIRALGTIRDPRAFRPLLDLMKDEDPRLAEDCAEALKKITGQDFGRSVEIWERWWADHGERLLAGESPDLPEKPKEEPDRGGPDYYHGIPVRSNRTIFIIDVSESMSYSNREFTEMPKEGELSRLGLAKRELLRAIDHYDPLGTFGLIAFDSIVKAWRPGLVKPSKVMKEDAKEWTEKLTPTGTTNIYGALEVAFLMAGARLADKYYPPRADTVFLLSDGAPTNADLSDDDPERILRAVREWNRAGAVKIHTIGMKGHSAYFMSELARQNGGTYSSRE